MDRRAVELTWRDGLFAHWRVDPERVRPLVPDELAVDVRDGSAWVSALASTVEAARPRGLPAALGLTFPQVNLRTYVRRGDRPGVYFLSLDAATPLGVRVARALWGLPYYRAAIDVERDGDRTRFESSRAKNGARFEAAYRPTGEAAPADLGSLDAFLAERYRLYLVRGETVWCARVEHDPWALRDADATVRADALVEATGLPAPTDDPRVRYADAAAFTVRTPFRA